ncbi:hypothetical protein Pfo_000877 [Paulownia fortunei]|nr:hypothetical protein Pfo_000877 [Paulownia fortunei]
MKVIKIIFFIMAITLTLNSQPAFLERKPAATKRVSRFLQQKGNSPRIADQCNEDNQVCSYFLEGGNATCCNNKCIETGYDVNNCGACGKKCAFREVCCRGECVDPAYDKRHCGFCNNMCMIDGNCVYGICDYA